jgi:hypothetical protein
MAEQTMSDARKAQLAAEAETIVNNLEKDPKGLPEVEPCKARDILWNKAAAIRLLAFENGRLKSDVRNYLVQWTTQPPAGPGFRAVRALRKRVEGNPEGGRKTRTRKSRRVRKTRRSRK